MAERSDLSSEYRDRAGVPGFTLYWRGILTGEFLKVLDALLIATGVINDSDTGSFPTPGGANCVDDFILRGRALLLRELGFIVMLLFWAELIMVSENLEVSRDGPCERTSPNLFASSRA